MIIQQSPANCPVCGAIRRIDAFSKRKEFYIDREFSYECGARGERTEFYEVPLYNDGWSPADCQIVDAQDTEWHTVCPHAMRIRSNDAAAKRIAELEASVRELTAHATGFNYRLAQDHPAIVRALKALGVKAT